MNNNFPYKSIDFQLNPKPKERHEQKTTGIMIRRLSPMIRI